MPTALKCPTCNAPLATPPTGPDAKCTYCGALLVGTRMMQQPMVPPAVQPPQGFPQFPAKFPPQTPGVFVQVPSVQGWRTSYIIGSVMTVVLVAGGIAAAIFMQSKAQEQVAAATAAATGTAPATRLPDRPLELGKLMSVDLPGRVGFSTADVIAPFTFDIPEKGPYEVSFIGSVAFVSCYLRVTTPDDKTIERTEEDSSGQTFTVLEKGAHMVLAYCDSHPAARSLRVVVRPVPVLQVGTPARGTLENGMEATGALFAIEAAGLYAIALECEDSSTALEVLGADDTLVGRESVSAPVYVGVIEEHLEPGGYLARAARSFAADSKLPVTFAVNRIEPEPIQLGVEASAVMSRFTPNRYYLVTIDAPTKLSATLNTQAFDHSVEIQQVDGVRLADSGRAPSGRPAKTTTDQPLAPGSYRVVVREQESSEAAEGPFALTVEAAAEQPAPAPRRRGR